MSSSDPLSPSGLDRFAEVAAGHVGPGRIPGLVALVARKDQVHVEAHGSWETSAPPAVHGEMQTAAYSAVSR